MNLFDILDDSDSEDEVDTGMQRVDVHNNKHDKRASPIAQYPEQHAWLFKHGWGDRCNPQQNPQQSPINTLLLKIKNNSPTLKERWKNLDKHTVIPKITLSGITLRDEQITELIIYRMELTALPNLSALRYLTSLNCSHNQLVNLPELSALDWLEFLDCSHNQLRELPDLSALDQLKEVDCSHNKLRELPAFSVINKLEKLFWYNNPLEDMDMERQKVEALYTTLELWETR